MIQAQYITFGHLGEPLYHQTSFSLPRGKKAGLVGLNGSGKSTLFQLITRQEWPEAGRIIVEGSTLLVPQEVSSDPLQNQSSSIRDYLHSARPHADHYLRRLLHHLEMGDLTLTTPPQKLSGGQKTKLAILHAVLSHPDNLLLDEPTNFLDTAGKKWIMHWLSSYPHTLMVVSHDLQLLDHHIDKVIYINHQTKKFEEYTGTYSKFIQLKQDRDQHLSRYIKNQQKKINKMHASVQALRRKTSDRGVKQRVQLEKRITRIQDKLPELPQEIVNIKLHLPPPAHIGSLPLQLKHVSKSFASHQVLQDINFSIPKGHRYVLIGPNGVGKTTLIKIIMGILTPDFGSVVLDSNAKIGYYSQEFQSLDQTLSLFTTVNSVTQTHEGKIRAFLARFMFPHQRLRQKVATLSGGEKTRLAIALLMLQDYNFLILDEPTTYLDVLSQKIILEALKLYQGTMLIVSHTPDFLSGLTPHQALLLPQEKLVYWDNSLLPRSAEI